MVKLGRFITSLLTDEATSSSLSKSDVDAMPSMGMSFVMLTLYKLLFDGFYWCNDTVMCEIGILCNRCWKLLMLFRITNR